MLNKVVARTTPQQRSWLAGFFAGFEAAQGGGLAQPLCRRRRPTCAADHSLRQRKRELRSARVNKAKKAAQKYGLDAKVFDMADVEPTLFSPRRRISSSYAATWGEGDPPARAVDFYQALMSDAAPRLDGVPDLPSWRWAIRPTRSSAPIGKAIDARFEELGGSARRSIASTSISIIAKKAARSGRKARWPSSRLKMTCKAAVRSCTSIFRVALSHRPMTTSRSTPPSIRSKPRSRRWSI